MSVQSFPVPSPEGGLRRYLREIQKFPVLDGQEEFALAKRWREHGEIEAAHSLVTSHLRLVAKIARGYRGYGLPLADLIAEGNLGLMRAVKGFDPDRGFRLATYAIWWIRAAITEYVLRSWSVVKIGTVAAQKKLFFGLRKIKEKLRILDNSDLSPEQTARIAKSLDVPEKDVVSMNRRLSGADLSLNAPLSGEDATVHQDLLVDARPNQETLLLESNESRHRKRLLRSALSTLNAREKHILTERRLKDTPLTLEELGKVYGISRERVRQIESRAFERLQAAVTAEMAQSQTPAGG